MVEKILLRCKLCGKLVKPTAGGPDHHLRWRHPEHYEEFKEEKAERFWDFFEKIVLPEGWGC